VTLHPLAEQFASVADAYERGRPEHPRAVAGAIAAELALAPGAPVLDLAAGTGKLSRALLAAGLDVVAVEPHAALRVPLSASVGAERVRDGLAEAIPLADASVAAVTVGDAFHWFDAAVALAEIRRVLTPGGGLVIVSTVADWSGASWAHELGTLIRDSRPEHPQFDGQPWQEAVRADGHWDDPRELRITFARPTDAGQMRDWIASFSWIAAMRGDERAATLQRIAELIASGDTPAEMPVHVTLGIAQLQRRAGAGSG
jgi:SAM-dependent methyltransferase